MTAVLLATAERAQIGGPESELRTLLADHARRLDARTAMRVNLLLWRSAGDRAHLVEAKRLLDLLVENAPPECRESMLANVRLNREIVAAAREHRVG